MAGSDGPFGTAPDIGIGFSDAALLTFSVVGFGFLAYSTFIVFFYSKLVSLILHE